MDARAFDWDVSEGVVEGVVTFVLYAAAQNHKTMRFGEDWGWLITAKTAHLLSKTLDKTVFFWYYSIIQISFSNARLIAQ